MSTTGQAAAVGVETGSAGGGPMRALGRMAGVLLSPVTTFRDIARSHEWLVPLLVIVLLSVGTVFLNYEKLEWESMFRSQLEGYFSGADLDAQVETRMDFWTKPVAGTTLGKIFLIGQIGIFFPIILVLLALVFWGGTTAMGGKITFGRTLSVAVYAWVPKLVEGLLATAVLFVRPDPIRADLTPRLLLTNPASFLAEADSGTGLYALAGGLNLFTIWMMVLFAIGLSEVGRMSRGTAATLVFILYALFVGCSAGLAAAF